MISCEGPSWWRLRSASTISESGRRKNSKAMLVTPHSLLIARSGRGWNPVLFLDKDLQKQLESRAAGEPISELEDLYHDPHKGDMLLLGPGPDAEKLTLEDLMELVPYEWVLRIFGNTREYQPGTIPTLMISRPTIKGILDAVRNEVLRWSLALESQGNPGAG
jgi:hypothetical protein